MQATLMLVALALVLAPVTAVLPEASAHYVCAGPRCDCPPDHEGTHVHVDTNPIDACADA